MPWPPFPVLLAMVDFSNPLLWAVLIGWTLSVVLHELAHGVVAHLGGDYTIRERGGLSLNPLQYVHPVNSIALPLVFMLMGGIPLPGGATYVRTDLLRNRAWSTAVSLAGPATNFALFFALILPLHPRFHWLAPYAPPSAWTNAQQFLAVLASLQFLMGVLNLFPIPPLDGFNAIAPYLGHSVQKTLGTPQAATFGLLFLFALLWSNKHALQPVFDAEQGLMDRMGMDDAIYGMVTAYNAIL